MEQGDLMTSALARQRAAQAWCAPTTSNITMIPELAFVFADMLEEAWNSPIVANATTRALLEEIESRAEQYPNTVFEGD